MYKKKHAHMRLQCLNFMMLIRFMSSRIDSRNTGAYIVTDQLGYCKRVTSLDSSLIELETEDQAEKFLRN
jgi:hypothetical protein